MSLVSIVIPCYESEKCITKIITEITETFEQRKDFNYEIILVNDCSPDGFWIVAKALAEKDYHIKIIDLAQNFGQQSALMAGLHYVSGDIIVCMDDDEQTPPRQIFRLIDRLDNDCDLVFAKYENKKHPLWRNIGTLINNYALCIVLKKPKKLAAMSYFACKRYVIEEVKHYRNSYPHLGGLLLRATLKADNVIIDHRPRSFGKSTYTFRKLFSLWLNGVTAFSALPLRLATLIGSVCSLLGLIYGGTIMIISLLSPFVPDGHAILTAALFFIGGLFLVTLGVVGECLGRMYICINDAPQFVIRDTINLGTRHTED